MDMHPHHTHTHPLHQYTTPHNVSQSPWYEYMNTVNCSDRLNYYACNEDTKGKKKIKMLYEFLWIWRSWVLVKPWGRCGVFPCAAFIHLVWIHWAIISLWSFTKIWACSRLHSIDQSLHFQLQRIPLLWVSDKQHARLLACFLMHIRAHQMCCLSAGDNAVCKEYTFIRISLKSKHVNFCPLHA